MDIKCGSRGTGYVYKFEGKNDLRLFIKMNPELYGIADEMLDAYIGNFNSFRFFKSMLGRLDYGNMREEDYISMGYKVIRFVGQRSE